MVFKTDSKSCIKSEVTGSPDLGITQYDEIEVHQHYATIPYDQCEDQPNNSEEICEHICKFESGQYNEVIADQYDDITLFGQYEELPHIYPLKPEENISALATTRSQSKDHTCTKRYLALKQYKTAL